MTRSKWTANKLCNDTSITTSSGKFTFYPKNWLSRKEAKKFCEKKDGILAPITNRPDLEALHKFASGCINIGLGRSYFVGLDMTDPDTRYFTNGVVYKEDVHGSFHYVSNSKGKLPACWETFFGTYPSDIQGMITTYNGRCVQLERRFICLNPAISTSTCN